MTNEFDRPTTLEYIVPLGLGQLLAVRQQQLDNEDDYLTEIVLEDYFE